MLEKQLQVFIDGVIRYFQHTSDKQVDVGTPYLMNNNEIASGDYIGVISISGSYEGCCYFAAPSILLKHLVLSMGENDTSDEMLKDTVGEVANTLSGNARQKLGKDFIISVPMVSKGGRNSERLFADSRSYVIPISWKSYKASLGICLS